MTLMHGDCLELLKDIPDKSIDCIITDPPYKFGNKGGGFYSQSFKKGREYIKELNNLSCCEFKPNEFLESIRLKLKKFYGYFFCNKTLLNEYLSWAEKNKYQFDLLTMIKSNPIPACNNHHVSDIEYIVLIREKGTYFAKHEPGTPLDDFRKWFMTTCTKGVHPAQKPVELIERFINISTVRGGVILDPFMGSGTTGVAAAKLGRDFIGIEQDQKYFDIAKDRINKEIKESESLQS